MTLGNANYDSILATTLANYQKTLVDNVFTARPLVAWLKAKDKIKLITGGAKIVEQLMYAQNQAAGSYSGYDTLPLTASAGISAAEFPWKQFAASIAINGLEEAENSGEAAIIDLLSSKIMQAEETMAEQMNAMFFNSGQGNSGKDWWGLGALLAVQDITQNGTPVGNISVGITTVPVSGTLPTQNQWWSPYVDYGTGGTIGNQLVTINGVANQTVPNCIAPTTQVATALTQTDMAHLYNLASLGNNNPDFGLAGQRVFEKYETLLTPNLRFEDSDTADGGFQNLKFKGLTLMFDVMAADYLPASAGSQEANNLWMMNSKYLALKGDKNRWFTHTPFVRPPNQDARYAQVLCYGNLTISNRMRQGVLLNRY